MVGKNAGLGRRTAQITWALVVSLAACISTALSQESPPDASSDPPQSGESEGRRHETRIKEDESWKSEDDQGAHASGETSDDPASEAPSSGATATDDTAAASGEPAMAPSEGTAEQGAQKSYPETIPVAADAQQEPPPSEATQLDEITVTAQKRGLEAIKDVPISISVVDEKMIFDWGIPNVREAMLFVPNVKVEESGFFMIPRIRGFITNNQNKAFEPPAGLALDGIPYGRVEYFNAGLFDVKRLEVLRGPQGTTFGKNTSAGLIHIMTKDPSDEWNGYIDLQQGDYERERVEGGIGGAVIDDFLNVRVAGMVDSNRGFMENTTAAILEQADPFLLGRDNKGYRIKLQAPDLFSSNLKIGFESVEMRSLGSGYEIFSSTEAYKETLLKYDPNTDFVPHNYITSLDHTDYRLTEIQTINGEWTYSLGSWGITALGGKSEMTTIFQLDSDFTPAPAIILSGFDRAPTTTVELRTLSPRFTGLLGLDSLFAADLGDSDFVLGVFHQKTAIEDGWLNFVLGNEAFLELTAAAEGSGNSAEDPPLASDIAGFAPPAAGGPTGTSDDVLQDFAQHSETNALFGQVQWQFLPEWAVHLGGRFSQEKKDAWWRQVFQSPPPNSILLAGGFEEFEARRERTDTSFQPRIALNYQPWGNLSLFAHWARANKAGGFNAFAFRGEEEELVYDPESSTEWGFDIKDTLFDRSLSLNLSFYRMDIKDFQVLTREPQTTTIGLGVSKVENAAVARAQGLEGDLTWVAASWLRMFMTLGINDTEYLNFPINDCAPDRDNTDGDDDVRCDASGRPFAFAPKYNGSLTTSLTPLWTLWGVNFTAAVSAEYQSEQYLDADLDPRKLQEDFWRWRASTGFGHASQGWSFKVVGENLTDQRTYNRMGDIAPKQIIGISEPPRRIFGQFRWTF